MTPQRKKHRLRSETHTHTHTRMITHRKLTGDWGALVVNNSPSLPLIFSFLSISVLSNPCLFMRRTAFSLIQTKLGHRAQPYPSFAHTHAHTRTCASSRGHILARRESMLISPTNRSQLALRVCVRAGVTEGQCAVNQLVCQDFFFCPHLRKWSSPPEWPISPDTGRQERGRGGRRDGTFVNRVFSFRLYMGRHQMGGGRIAGRDMWMDRRAEGEAR